MVAVASAPPALRGGPFLAADEVRRWIDTLGDLDRYREFAAACVDVERAGASPELAVVLVLRREGEEAAEADVC